MIKKTWGRKSPWTVPLTATEIHLGKNMLGLQHLGTAGADHAVDDGYLLQHGTEFLHVWRVVFKKNPYFQPFSPVL